VRIRYSPRASAQIEEAFDYIARNSPTAAQAFLGRIEAIETLLAQFPRMGRDADEANVHSVPLTPFRYRLFYAVRPGRGEIMILRIRHMARGY
jgi:plasmid stabilization system protein ParE